MVPTLCAGFFCINGLQLCSLAVSPMWHKKRKEECLLAGHFMPLYKCQTSGLCLKKTRTAQPAWEGLACCRAANRKLTIATKLLTQKDVRKYRLSQIGMDFWITEQVPLHWYPWARIGWLQAERHLDIEILALGLCSVMDIEVSAQSYLDSTVNNTETKMKMDSEPRKGSTCWPLSHSPMHNLALKSAPPPAHPRLLLWYFRREKYRSFSVVVADANEELWKISSLGKFGASL